MKYYCLGIKGTGMSTLAQILSDMGNEVCGYDDVRDWKFTQKGLEDRNIAVYYDREHRLDKDMIVTYSVALPLTHPELVRCRENGLQIRKYNEIVGDVTKLFRTISVSGTHGKTTTSSLIRHILESTVGTNYFIGAGDGHVSRDNEYFVIESDEFNKHFVTYWPTYTVITNIEEEHMECYDSLQDIIDTFGILASHTAKFIVACGDSENVRKVQTDREVLYYGFNDNNDIKVTILDLGSDYSRFNVCFEDMNEDFEIPLFGEHMVLNASAAVALCYRLGISPRDMKKALRGFKNARRRMEETMLDNGTILIDDYAHHPTEIAATISSVKQKYPGKHITAIFKPNTYSRTEDFTQGFIDCLEKVDKVYLTEIDSNRERQEDYPGVSSRMITDGIEGAEIIDENDVSVLDVRKGDVLLVMSCASVSHLLEHIENRYNKKD
ncbi:MAG: UDP-N-acetylmuramate--L-alanine ligase [Erysipelotrichaceae bacterium]|nr:UDP-N-acetylmuramate--L-alanine ligase [Erysipelotrichaceae bacterium]